MSFLRHAWRVSCDFLCWIGDLRIGDGFERELVRLRQIFSDAEQAELRFAHCGLRHAWLQYDDLHRDSPRVAHLSDRLEQRAIPALVRDDAPRAEADPRHVSPSSP